MARDERPRWHVFLDTQERTPGVWTLVDGLGRDYGEVRIVRVGESVGYVGTFRGTDVGRWTTLRASLDGVHGVFIRAHAPGGFAPNPWPKHDESASPHPR